METCGDVCGPKMFQSLDTAISRGSEPKTLMGTEWLCAKGSDSPRLCPVRVIRVSTVITGIHDVYHIYPYLSYLYLSLYIYHIYRLASFSNVLTIKEGRPQPCSSRWILALGKVRCGQEVECKLWQPWRKHMEMSWNGVTPKWMVYIGNSQ